MVAVFVVGIFLLRTNSVQSELVTLNQGSWTTQNVDSNIALPAEDWTEYSQKDAGIVAGVDLHLESASYAITQTSDDGVTDTCETDLCSAAGGFNASTAMKTGITVSGTGSEASITLTTTLSPSNIIQSVLGTIDTGNAASLDIAGSSVYMADSKDGLNIIDVSDPLNPQLAGTYAVSGTAKAVAVSGKHAYVVADDLLGLQIIKVNKPSKLKLTGSYAVSGTANDVAVLGKYAYVVADGALGLQIIDISKPKTPTLAGSFAVSGIAKGIALSGNHAYIAAEDKFDLQIIKVSKLSKLKQVGKLKITGKVKSITISGNYAYLTGENSGLNIVDISNPKKPKLIGSYATAGKAKGVAVVGNLAYVAMNNYGMATVDIAIPSVPALIKTYDSPGKAKDVIAVNNSAYIADGKSGLQIVQTTESSGYFASGSFQSSAMDLGSNVYDLDAVISDVVIPSGGLPVGSQILSTESGLLAVWHMNTNDSSQTSAVDPVGANNGTLHTAASGTNTSTSDMWDSAGNLGTTTFTAMEFDGTDDYVSVDVFLTGIKTVMFWINHANPTLGDEILEFNGSQSISITHTTGDITTSGFQLPTVYVDGSTEETALTPGWHHVAVVTSTGIVASDLNIGRVVTGYLAGLMDEVAIYDRVLTANEINKIYNGLPVKFQVAASDCFNGANDASACTSFIGWGDNDTPFIGSDGTASTYLEGPMALYYFDEGTGAVISDVSGYGHDGALNIGGSGSQTSSVEAWANGTSLALANLGSQGLAFDGTDDYVAVGNIKADVKSIELWINHSSNNFGGVILELNAAQAIVITTANKVVANGFGDSNVYVDGSSSSAVLSSGWHHVAVVTDTAIDASNVNLGRVGMQYFAGSLDEVAIYEWAFSAGAVKSRYNNGKGKKGAVFGGLSGASLDKKQYLKFKAYMSTDSMLVGPQVNDVTMGVSAFPSGAGLVSSVFDTGDDNSFLTDISWSETLKSHDVRVQVATSGDQLDWNYCGALNCSKNDWIDFTGNAGGYYTIASGSSPHSQSKNADSDRYIKYKIWLMSTDGMTTPTVDDITISYDTAHLEVYAPNGTSNSYEPQALTPFNIIVNVMDSSGTITSNHDGSRLVKLTASIAQPDMETCFSSFSENGNTELTRSVTFFSGTATFSNVVLCDSSVKGGFTVSAAEMIGGALSSTADLTITNIKDPGDKVTATLYWDPLDDCANFDHYEAWYGMASNVTRGIGLNWDDKSDPAMAICSTGTTTIADLLPDVKYYFSLFAIDSDGNAIALDFTDSTVDGSELSNDLVEDESTIRPTGALLYDVVVKLRDNHHSDPVEDARGSYKHGDVITIVKNGHLWTENEKNMFLIIQMYLTEEEKAELLSSEVAEDGRVIKRRLNRIDMEQLGLTADDSNNMKKRKHKSRQFRGKRLKKNKAAKAKIKAEKKAKKKAKKTKK